jgi:hypothetical protein
MCTYISKQYEKKFNVNLHEAIVSRYKGPIRLALVLWTQPLYAAIVSRIDLYINIYTDGSVDVGENKSGSESGKGAGAVNTPENTSAPPPAAANQINLLSDGTGNRRHHTKKSGLDYAHISHIFAKYDFWKLQRICDTYDVTSHNGHFQACVCVWVCMYVYVCMYV